MDTLDIFVFVLGLLVLGGIGAGTPCFGRNISWDFTEGFYEDLKYEEMTPTFNRR